MPRHDSLIRPPRLSPGDTIRVVAPASPFDRAVFDKGVAALESLGFRVSWGEDLFESRRYLAGSDERRARELMEAFEDRGSRAIVCARGGYGTPRILPLLDFARIARSPKVFVGFSDPTALHLAFARHGIVSFHGPNVCGLAAFPPERETFLAATTRPQPMGEIARGETVVPGRAEGPLVGGNLAMLAALAGTPFFPDLAGAILFVEDVGEKPFRIDRMLTTLRLAGALEGIAGIALGRFSGCVNPADTSFDGETIAKELARELGKPCIAGLAFGHEGENRTIPVGVRGAIEDGRLLALEAAVT